MISRPCRELMKSYGFQNEKETRIMYKIMIFGKARNKQLPRERKILYRYINQSDSRSVAKKPLTKCLREIFALRIFGKFFH